MVLHSSQYARRLNTKCLALPGVVQMPSNDIHSLKTGTDSLLRDISTSRISLTEHLERHSTTDKGVTFVHGSCRERLTWGEMLDLSAHIASALRDAGFDHDSSICVVGPTTRDLVLVIEAALLVGATVSVLPVPGRIRDSATYVALLRERIQTIGATLLIYDHSVSWISGVDYGCRQFPLSKVIEIGRNSRQTFSLSGVRSTLVQFTSGSTGSPKALAVGSDQLLLHVESVAKAADMTSEDIFISWLPLFHDMGLIGLLMCPMLLGLELVIADQSEFVTSPSSWMNMTGFYRGTVIGGPNFSYAIASRTARSTGGVSLDSVRLAFNGSERVDRDVTESFCEAMAPMGFRSQAMFPVFGMAEAILAVTFPRPQSGAKFDLTDRSKVTPGEYMDPITFDSENSQSLAILGSPIPNVDLRICEPSIGTVLGNRVLGELQISGPCMAAELSIGPNSLKQRPAQDEWIKTGDLGYLAEDQFVACGRIKDLIIMAGRNHDPAVIEKVVSNVPGIRRGNVIAIGIPKSSGTEAIIVVAEISKDLDRPSNQSLGKIIRRTVLDRCGVQISEVALIEPGSLPKTGSGKLRRSYCRDQYLNNDLSLS